MQNDLMDPRKKALVDAMGGGGAQAGFAPPGIQPDQPIGGSPASGPSLAEAANGPQGIVQQAASSTLGSSLAAPPPAPRNSTRLMEGDAGKLGDVGHAAKSPKYDFLQLANQGKYGYDQLGGMLGELQQGPNAKHWQGWTADKDKLRFKGDKSQLGDAWKGVTEVDAIGGFNSGNPQGFRWGAEDPNAQAAPQGGGMGAGAPSFAGSTINPALQGNAQDSIQAALAQLQQGGASGNIMELIKQLGGAQ